MSKQCFEQAHMTCAEFGLWVQYQKLAYKSGRLFCDGRRTAERFKGESKDHIYRLRRSLVANGWLEVVKGSERDKTTQRVTVTEFRVLDHAAWVKKHGKKSCKTALFSDMEPVAPVQMAAKKPVAPVQMPCRACANEPVAPARHSTKEHQLQENIEIKFGNVEPKTLNIEKEVLLGGQSIRLAEPSVPPFAPVQMDQVNDPLVVGPFAELTNSQLVGMLPVKEGMKLYHKYMGSVCKRYLEVTFSPASVMFMAFPFGLALTEFSRTLP
jgi:hypothetical protein